MIIDSEIDLWWKNTKDENQSVIKKVALSVSIIRVSNISKSMIIRSMSIKSQIYFISFATVIYLNTLQDTIMNRYLI